jgi:transcriptional regulator with XRE-family HTH domain
MGVVKLDVRTKRSFTQREQLIDDLRGRIFAAGVTYKKIAEQAGVSATTVRALASGDTMWPRPKTLFGILAAVNCGLEVVSLG